MRMVALACILVAWQGGGVALYALGKPVFSGLGGLTQAWMEIGSTLGRAEGVMAIQENPAGLAFSRHFELAACVQWPSAAAGATGSEYVALAMAAVLPLGSSQGRQAIGIQGVWLDGGALVAYDAQGNWLGDRKTTWGEGDLSWGIRLGPSTGFGLGVRVAAPELADEPASGALSAGAQWRLLPKGRLALALLVESPWLGDPTPSLDLRLGAVFLFIPELSLGAEARWAPGDDAEGRMGLVFAPFQALRLGAGFSLRGVADDAARVFLGIEIRLARLAITLTHAGAAGQSDILALGIRHAW